jgi:hypothetical protein
MTSWFRRHEAPKPAAEAEPEDSPAALLRSLRQLVAFINQNAGKLPGESVVAARRVTDAVAEVIDTSNDNGELDVYAIISVKGIVNDYLPTTLRAYLALDPQGVEVPGRSGRTPRESLFEQITSLWAAAADVLTAAQDKDANALVSQGNFLRTKFTGSDLDL